jgi:hypothetical protein
MREPERAEIEHPEGGPARGERSESNPQVRFDEGEQRAWRKPPVALYSTGWKFLSHQYWPSRLRRHFRSIRNIRLLSPGRDAPATLAPPGANGVAGGSEFAGRDAPQTAWRKMRQPRREDAQATLRGAPRGFPFGFGIGEVADADFLVFLG